MSHLPNTFDYAVIRVIQGEGECRFVAADVAEVLGYHDPLVAISQHCRGAPNWLPVVVSGGTQRLRLIDKEDVARLIVSSTSSDSQQFEPWLSKDLLVQIMIENGRENWDCQELLNDPVELRALLLLYVEKVIELQHQIAQQAVSPNREEFTRH